MKKNFFFFFFFFFIQLVQSFKDAGKVLRNEKNKTTDEFLVKKKNL